MVRRSKHEFLPEIDIARSYRSKRAFQQAKHWLSDCLNQHTDCKVINPGFVPHRLLDLSGEGSVRLLVDPTKSASYVCLSYCWGSDTRDIVQTTTDNFKAHCHGILISSLAQTIQDAIVVCRALEVMYLWVDGLCIIQGDGEDFKKESSQMADIYRNCLFTIAAKEPDSCKKGFLRPQRHIQPQLQRNLRIEVPAFLGGPVKEILAWSVPEAVSMPDDIMSTEVLNASTSPKSAIEYSLDTRGWCLQESILPNRVLSFNDVEMAWECVQRHHCECNGLFHQHNSEEPKVENRLERGFKPLYNGSSFSTLDPLGLVRLSHLEYHEKWVGLVEDYSRRHLTHGSDKLIAISGLAKLFLTASSIANNGIQDGYYAGLWGRYFIQQLAWSVDPLMLRPTGRSQHTRYEGFCVPTWSWASIDGPVRYWRSSKEPNYKYGVVLDNHIEVKTVCCEPAPPSDPIGSIASPFAELTGPIVEVQLAVLEEELGSRRYEYLRVLSSNGNMPLHVWESGVSVHKTPCLVRAKNLEAFEVLVDTPMEPTLRRDQKQSDCWVGSRCERDCCRWGSPIDGASPRYFCLKLFSWKADPKRTIRQGHLFVDGQLKPVGRDFDPETWFLVLKLSTTQPRAYERIGIGCWTGLTERFYSNRSFRLFEDCKTETIHLV